MNKMFVFISLIVLISACQKEQGESQDLFRNKVFTEFNNESKNLLMDDSWKEANKFRTRNQRTGFKWLNNFHKKLDELLELSEAGKNSLMDSSLLNELKTNYLTLRFNYQDHKGSYSYPKDEAEMETLNPTDTADFIKSVSLFEVITNRSLTQELRKLYLTELTNQYLNYYANQLPRDGNFSPIELTPKASQNIWKKGERAYLIVDYYGVGERNYSKVKIGDQLFDKTPITIKAPKEKGLHEIKGELFIKEAGVEVAKPFSYRIWVE